MVSCVIAIRISVFNTVSRLCLDGVRPLSHSLPCHTTTSQAKHWLYILPFMILGKGETRIIQLQSKTLYINSTKSLTQIIIF